MYCWGTVLPVLAFYIVAAEEQGVDQKKLAVCNQYITDEL